MNNIAIFASGTGSNFLAIHQAIKEKTLNASISLFVSDKPNSVSAKMALELGLNVYIFNSKSYKNKKEYEVEILQKLRQENITLIVLAGYMKIIGKTILDEYERRIINIHPSLLPLYKGKDAIAQAYNDNALKTGVTIHYVDKGIDTGDIISQEEIKIYPEYSLSDIEREIHKVEHSLYSKTIQKLLEEQYEKSLIKR